MANDFTGNCLPEASATLQHAAHLLNIHVGSRSFCNPVATTSLSFAFRMCRGTVYSGFAAFTSTITFSDEIKASSQPLEPAFENLLRTANLHEDVLNALRMEDILDREMLVSLDTTEEVLAKSAKDPSESIQRSISLTRRSWRN